ncbi:hypothetical protein [Neorhizobium galegae]|uniref:hypothetical protein n=1 Tax=Neorhizobium galegae TaxID=399 RepID=UPI000621B0B0|nr:hypothetical protein [Neorhizobium galegae]CDZ57017.1 Hypothetical protein NGAL_HAMBI2566_15690 [Neorhizobium galegae bv. orientalis]KAB1127068.1 hypothetical protein F4V90_08295 [Neorhizobium galegae]MCQ1573418.1 hypothetical protein [Neorhizobium galegae]MCQ1808765.1 hypothetical protein [Neorhizobium galegae]MCQ1834414.1 hypothetical protein [Neorhizobium galegae]
MKKCTYSTEREEIVAQAISPVASELRLLDAGDLISLLRLECHGSLADLVSSAAELYFHPGTVSFGSGGDYKLEWNGKPEVVLDLEIKPRGVSVYARLTLADQLAALEIDHIAFQAPFEDPHDNTAFLAKSLQEAKFVKTSNSQM